MCHRPAGCCRGGCWHPTVQRDAIFSADEIDAQAQMQATAAVIVAPRKEYQSSGKYGTQRNVNSRVPDALKLKKLKPGAMEIDSEKYCCKNKCWEK